MKIGIIPYSSAYCQNRLFDLSGSLNRDNSLQVWHDFYNRCSSLGWTVQTVDDTRSGFDVYLILDPHPAKLRLLSTQRLSKSIVQFSEPPDVAPQQYDKDNLERVSKVCPVVFCSNRDLCLSYSFEHRPWYVDLYPQRESNIIPAQNRHGICMIATNKFNRHPESQLGYRLSFVKSIACQPELWPQFNLYGRDWLTATGLLRSHLPFSAYGRPTFADKVLLRIEKKIPRNSSLKQCYRGVTGSKGQALSQHRFNLIVENMYWDGYVTEKIFDALQYGCVPIYFGASDVTDYIPAELFINGRRHSNPLDVIQSALSLNESELNRMIQSGQDWLHSEDFETKHGRSKYIQMLQDDFSAVVRNRG